MNTTTKTEAELARDLRQAAMNIQFAEMAGRSQSTINRLWRKYFQIEDVLKAFGGGL